MKVIIELNENVSVGMLDDNPDICEIYIKPNSSNGLVAQVKIEDLKIAIRKITAK